jgi:cation transport ATPase
VNKESVNKDMKSSITFIGLSLIPILIILFLVLIMPKGLDIGKYPWYVFVAAALFVLFVIINPIYLTVLSRHYLIKHGISFALSIAAMIFFGIGSILVLNWERFKANSSLDFKNEMMFFYELTIVSIILLFGIAVIAYSRFKGKV